MPAYFQDVGAEASWPIEATRRMNRMYRRQRHIYDGTRRYYLLGRDQLISGLRPDAGASVLEIGCGTGRNLVLASQLYPAARFFGVDVSTEMLTSAIAAISRYDLTSRVRVAHGDGTAFDPLRLFGLPRFDHVMISYSLSMIPDWRGVLQAAASISSAVVACTSSISVARSDCPVSPARFCCDGSQCSTSRRATISSANCRRWLTAVTPI